MIQMVNYKRSINFFAQNHLFSIIRNICVTVWMAVMKYFQLKTTHKQPLLDPNGKLSSKILLSEFFSANVCIGKLLNSTPSSDDDHSRGPYAILSPA